MAALIEDEATTAAVLRRVYKNFMDVIPWSEVKNRKMVRILY